MIEIVVLIIVGAIVLPIVLSMLFDASFTRPTDSIFYNVTGVDSTIMSDDADNDYNQAVGQRGTLFNGKRINSVSVDMANTNNISVGNITFGIYSITGNSISLEKLFDVIPVTEIPVPRTTFSYQTDYVMDSNDAVMLVASEFETLPNDLITVYTNNNNPISNTNFVARSASDLVIDDIFGTDTVSLMVETVQTEDTQFITMIGVMATIALIILLLILLRSAFN